MKEFRGTKGKWSYHVTGGKAEYYHNIQEGDWGKTIALMYDKHCSDDEIKANAQLIASAPELLELIQEMSDYLEPKHEGQINSINTTSTFHNQMRLLISKALGE